MCCDRLRCETEDEPDETTHDTTTQTKQTTQPTAPPQQSQQPRRSIIVLDEDVASLTGVLLCCMLCVGLGCVVWCGVVLCFLRVVHTTATAAEAIDHRVGRGRGESYRCVLVCFACCSCGLCEWRARVYGCAVRA